MIQKMLTNQRHRVKCLTCLTQWEVFVNVTVNKQTGGSYLSYISRKSEDGLRVPTDKTLRHETTARVRYIVHRSTILYV